MEQQEEQPHVSGVQLDPNLTIALQTLAQASDIHSGAHHGAPEEESNSSEEQPMSDDMMAEAAEEIENLIQTEPSNTTTQSYQAAFAEHAYGHETETIADVMEQLTSDQSEAAMEIDDREAGELAEEQEDTAPVVGDMLPVDLSAFSAEISKSGQSGAADEVNTVTLIPIMDNGTVKFVPVNVKDLDKLDLSSLVTGTPVAKDAQKSEEPLREATKSDVSNSGVTSAKKTPKKSKKSDRVLEEGEIDPDTFDDEKRARKHARKGRSQVAGEFVCDICDIHYCQISTLRKHVRDRHKNIHVTVIDRKRAVLTSQVKDLLGDDEIIVDDSLSHRSKKQAGDEQGSVDRAPSDDKLKYVSFVKSAKIGLSDGNELVKLNAMKLQQKRAKQQSYNKSIVKPSLASAATAQKTNTPVPDLKPKPTQISTPKSKPTPTGGGGKKNAKCMNIDLPDNGIVTNTSTEPIHLLIDVPKTRTPSSVDKPTLWSEEEFAGCTQIQATVVKVRTGTGVMLKRMLALPPNRQLRNVGKQERFYVVPPDNPMWTIAKKSQYASNDSLANNEAEIASRQLESSMSAEQTSSATYTEPQSSITDHQPSITEPQSSITDHQSSITEPQTSITADETGNELRAELNDYNDDEDIGASSQAVAGQPSAALADSPESPDSSAVNHDPGFSSSADNTMDSLSAEDASRSSAVNQGAHNVEVVHEAHSVEVEDSSCGYPTEDSPDLQLGGEEVIKDDSAPGVEPGNGRISLDSISSDLPSGPLSKENDPLLSKDCDPLLSKDSDPLLSSMMASVTSKSQLVSDMMVASKKMTDMLTQVAEDKQTSNMERVTTPVTSSHHVISIPAAQQSLVRKPAASAAKTRVVPARPNRVQMIAPRNITTTPRVVYPASGMPMPILLKTGGAPGTPQSILLKPPPSGAPHSVLLKAPTSSPSHPLLLQTSSVAAPHSVLLGTGAPQPLLRPGFGVVTTSSMLLPPNPGQMMFRQNIRTAPGISMQPRITGNGRSRRQKTPGVRARIPGVVSPRFGAVRPSKQALANPNNPQAPLTPTSGVLNVVVPHGMAPPSTIRLVEGPVQPGYQGNQTQPSYEVNQPGYQGNLTSAHQSSQAPPRHVPPRPISLDSYNDDFLPSRTSSGRKRVLPARFRTESPSDYEDNAGGGFSEHSDSDDTFRPNILSQTRTEERQRRRKSPPGGRRMYEMMHQSPEFPDGSTQPSKRTRKPNRKIWQFRETYECPICKKKLGLLKSLQRHLRDTHGKSNVHLKQGELVTLIQPISEVGQKPRLSSRGPRQYATPQSINTTDSSMSHFSDVNLTDTDLGFDSVPEIKEEDIKDESCTVVGSGWEAPQEQFVNGYECPVCLDTIIDFQMLNRHLQSDHKHPPLASDEGLTVIRLPISPEDAVWLKDESSIKPEESDPPATASGVVDSEGLLFACQICDKTYQTRGSLKRHVSQAHDPAAADDRPLITQRPDSATTDDSAVAPNSFFKLLASQDEFYQIRSGVEVLIEKLDVARVCQRYGVWMEGYEHLKHHKSTPLQMKSSPKTSVSRESVSVVIEKKSGRQTYNSQANVANAGVKEKTNTGHRESVTKVKEKKIGRQTNNSLANVFEATEIAALTSVARVADSKGRKTASKPDVSPQNVTEEFMCQQCMKGFDRLFKLNQHQRMAHKNIILPPKHQAQAGHDHSGRIADRDTALEGAAEQFMCRQCVKGFDGLFKLNQHQRRAHKNKILPPRNQGQPDQLVGNNKTDEIMGGLGGDNGDPYDDGIEEDNVDHSDDNDAEGDVHHSDTDDELDALVQNVIPKSKYPCPQCHHGYANEPSLKRHIQEKHEPPPAKRKMERGRETAEEPVLVETPRRRPESPRVELLSRRRANDKESPASATKINSSAEKRLKKTESPRAKAVYEKPRRSTPSRQAAAVVEEKSPAPPPSKVWTRKGDSSGNSNPSAFLSSAKSSQKLEKSQKWKHRASMITSGEGSSNKSTPVPTQGETIPASTQIEPISAPEPPVKQVSPPDAITSEPAAAITEPAAAITEPEEIEIESTDDPEPIVSTRSGRKVKQVKPLDDFYYPETESDLDYEESEAEVELTDEEAEKTSGVLNENVKFIEKRTKSGGVRFELTVDPAEKTNADDIAVDQSTSETNVADSVVNADNDAGEMESTPANAANENMTPTQSPDNGSDSKRPSAKSPMDDSSSISKSPTKSPKDKASSISKSPRKAAGPKPLVLQDAEGNKFLITGGEELMGQLEGKVFMTAEGKQLFLPPPESATTPTGETQAPPGAAEEGDVSSMFLEQNVGNTQVGETQKSSAEKKLSGSQASKSESADTLPVELTDQYIDDIYRDDSDDNDDNAADEFPVLSVPDAEDGAAERGGSQNEAVEAEVMTQLMDAATQPAETPLAAKPGGDEKPHACPICDTRFMYESSLDFHCNTIHGITITDKTNAEAADDEEEDDEDDANQQDESSLLEDEETRFPCNYCDKQYKNVQTLKVHIEGAHPDVPLVMCKKCGAHFSNDSELAMHRKFSCKGTPFVCRKCNKKCGTRYALKKHEKIHENEPSMRCNKCKFTFETEAAYKKHMKVHAGNGLFPCPHCDMKFVDRSYMERHMGSKHGVGKTHQCHICSKTYLLYSNLTKHMHDVHENDEEVIQCTECGVTFATKKSLKTHMLKHTGAHPYRCEVCGQGFHRPYDLNRHRLSHEEVDALACKTCGEVFEKLAEFSAHKKMHASERKHICDQCGREFSTPTHLKRHRVTHSDDKPFVCACGKGFNRKDLLDRHEKSHTGVKKHFCHVCGALFGSSTTLAAHTRIHTNERPYKCKYCPATFRQQNSLVVHNIKHTGPKQHKCQECDKAFSNKFALEVHVKIHAGRLPHRCPICPLSFSLRSGLEAHLQRHPPLPAKCDICGVIFPNVSLLTEHRRSHLVQKPVPNPDVGKSVGRLGQVVDAKSVPTPESVCHVCGKTFMRRVYLFNHMKTHQTEKDYACQVCGKRFKRSAEINAHMKSHSDERPYICEVCGKAFKQNGNLRIHQRTHTGELTRPAPEPGTAPGGRGRKAGPVVELTIKCSACDKTFASREAYIRHERTHTGERPFVCEVCFKLYRFQSALNVHMRTHTKEKPFACQFCGRGFSQKCALQVHERIHTGEKPFTCNVCQRGFRQRSSLMTHMFSHRADEDYQKLPKVRKSVAAGVPVPKDKYTKAKSGRKRGRPDTNLLSPEQIQGFEESSMESPVKSRRVFSDLYPARPDVRETQPSPDPDSSEKSGSADDEYVMDVQYSPPCSSEESDAEWTPGADDKVTPSSRRGRARGRGGKAPAARGRGAIPVRATPPGEGVGTEQGEVDYMSNRRGGAHRRGRGRVGRTGSKATGGVRSAPEQDETSRAIATLVGLEETEEGEVVFDDVLPPDIIASTPSVTKLTPSVITSSASVMTSTPRATTSTPITTISSSRVITSTTSTAVTQPEIQLVLTEPPPIVVQTTVSQALSEPESHPLEVTQADNVTSLPVQATTAQAASLTQPIQTTIQKMQSILKPVARTSSSGEEITRQSSQSPAVPPAAQQPVSIVTDTAQSLLNQIQLEQFPDDDAQALHVLAEASASLESSSLQQQQVVLEHPQVVLEEQQVVYDEPCEVEQNFTDLIPGEINPKDFVPLSQLTGGLPVSMVTQAGDTAGTGVTLASGAGQFNPGNLIQDDNGTVYMIIEYPTEEGQQ